MARGRRRWTRAPLAPLVALLSVSGCGDDARPLFALQVQPGRCGPICPSPATPTYELLLIRGVDALSACVLASARGLAGSHDTAFQGVAVAEGEALTAGVRAYCFDPSCPVCYARKTIVATAGASEALALEPVSFCQIADPVLARPLLSCTR